MEPFLIRKLIGFYIEDVKLSQKRLILYHIGRLRLISFQKLKSPLVFAPLVKPLNRQGTRLAIIG